MEESWLKCRVDNNANEDFRHGVGGRFTGQRRLSTPGRQCTQHTSEWLHRTTRSAIVYFIQWFRLRI